MQHTDWESRQRDSESGAIVKQSLERGRAPYFCLFPFPLALIISRGYKFLRNEIPSCPADRAREECNSAPFCQPSTRGFAVVSNAELMVRAGLELLGGADSVGLLPLHNPSAYDGACHIASNNSVLVEVNTCRNEFYFLFYIITSVFSFDAFPTSRKVYFMSTLQDRIGLLEKRAVGRKYMV